MKYFLCPLFLVFTTLLSAQEKYAYSLEANYFYGNILEHNPHIGHLITHHPEGLLLSLNKKTFGHEAWEARYNYPDLGYSFSYQNLKNTYLGENYGLYAHLGFYFLNRNLRLKVGQGLAYATNPYHPDENYINNAYGSRILSSTFFSGNFVKENIFKGLGFQAGFSLVHYSNADFKSPNNSTNTIAFNAGLNYLFNSEVERTYIPKTEEKYSEPIHYNLVMRGGFNTIGIIGSKSYPFFTFSAYADKRINRKSTFQGGAEFFLSRALEEFIYYQSVTFPFGETEGNEDAKRVGVFLGHQLTFHRLSLITHLGYYVYYPYDNYVERIYNRVGLQHPIYKNIFGSVTVRSHWANAEAVEFSIGYRL